MIDASSTAASSQRRKPSPLGRAFGTTLRNVVGLVGNLFGLPIVGILLHRTKHVSGLRGFTLAYRRYFRKAFEDLPWPNPEVKRRCRRVMRPYVKVSARDILKNTLSAQFIKLFKYITAITVFFSLPALVVGDGILISDRASYSFVVRKYAILFLIVISAPRIVYQSIGYALIARAIFKKRRLPADAIRSLAARATVLRKWTFIGTSALAILAFVGLARPATADSTMWIYEHAALVVVVTVVTWMSIEALGGAFSRWSSRQDSIANPEGNIAGQLLVAAELTGATNEHLGDLDKRRSLIFVIDRVSDDIERLVVPRLLGSDLASNQALRDRFKRISAGVRSLKVQIAIPASDSWERLQKSLLEVLTRFLLKEWESLPQTDPFVVTTAAVRNRILEGARAIAVGCVPFAVLFLVNRLFGPLPSERVDYALIASTLWMAGSIIGWIDPGASSRASASKELRDVVLGGRL